MSLSTHGTWDSHNLGPAQDRITAVEFNSLLKYQFSVTLLKSNRKKDIYLECKRLQ
jgi:hypothetical protein